MLAQKFIQANNYSPSDRTWQDVRLIVLHSEESPEVPNSAVNVANYFHNMPYSSESGASAHVTVDNKEVVGCVHPHDIAWAAPGANVDGLHIEQAGYAAQKDDASGWRDAYSLAVIDLAAQQAAEWIRAGAAAPVLLSTPQVADRKTRGICTHAMVTAAKLDPAGTHTDPGVNYPLDLFMANLKSHLAPTWPWSPNRLVQIHGEDPVFEGRLINGHEVVKAQVPNHATLNQLLAKGERMQVLMNTVHNHQQLNAIPNVKW